MKIGKCIITLLFLFYVASSVARAEGCPPAGSSLTKVRIAVDVFIKNGRAPAGADCAYSVASTFDLSNVAKFDDELLKFFQTATDVQRTAAKMRLSDNDKKEGRLYLKQEIELRSSLLNTALKRDSDENESNNLRPYIVSNLSYIVSAHGMLREYEEVTKVLGDQNSTYIDNEALKTWLQALWSCAKWDGKKQNVCKQENKQACKDKILVFLDSFSGMSDRRLPPQTRQDIERLKTLTQKGGCLR